jgi:hypothetical protein
MVVPMEKREEYA